MLELNKYDCEFKTIVDHYFKDRILFLKAGYVGETPTEDKTREVWFEDLKEDVPFELARYIRKNVVEASRRKGPFNTWAVIILKGHTRDIRYLYHVKDIDQGYRMEMARRKKSKNWKLNQRCQETSKRRRQ